MTEPEDFLDEVIREGTERDPPHRRTRFNWLGASILALLVGAIAWLNRIDASLRELTAHWGE